MDILVKMGSFQIKQNILNLKSTLINVCLLWLIKKFNMDILVKIGSFQIKQNVLNLKSTLRVSAY